MKNFLLFPVKKKKLFEHSEFFFFRERVKNLAPERQPAVFLFCYLFSFCCQKEKSNKHLIDPFLFLVNPHRLVVRTGRGIVRYGYTAVGTLSGGRVEILELEFSLVGRLL